MSVRIVLALAALGNMSQIEMVLFMLHHPKHPRQVHNWLLCVDVTGRFKEIATNVNTAVVTSLAMLMLAKFSLKMLATAKCVNQFGHIWQCVTNRIDPVCVTSPKTAKASTIFTFMCHCHLQFQRNCHQCKYCCGYITFNVYGSKVFCENAGNSKMCQSVWSYLAMRHKLKWSCNVCVTSPKTDKASTILTLMCRCHQQFQRNHHQCKYGCGYITCNVYVSKVFCENSSNSKMCQYCTYLGNK